MIRTETEFLMTQRFIRLSIRLDVSLDVLASKLLGIRSDDNSNLIELEKTKLRWIITSPDKTPKDGPDWVEYVLDRRKDLLKDSDWGEFFSLSSCQIEIDGAIFSYKMNTILGEWEEVKA